MKTINYLIKIMIIKMVLCHRLLNVDEYHKSFMEKIDDNTKNLNNQKKLDGKLYNYCSVDSINFKNIQYGNYTLNKINIDYYESSYIQELIFEHNNLLLIMPFECGFTEEETIKNFFNRSIYIGDIIPKENMNVELCLNDIYNYLGDNYQNISFDGYVCIDDCLMKNNVLISECIPSNITVYLIIFLLFLVILYVLCIFVFGLIFQINYKEKYYVIKRRDFDNFDICIPDKDFFKCMFNHNSKIWLICSIIILAIIMLLRLVFIDLFCFPITFSIFLIRKCFVSSTNESRCIRCYCHQKKLIFF